MTEALTHRTYLQRIRPGIELLSKYVNRETKVKYKCLNCNSIKEVKPFSLTLGDKAKKCPSCRIMGRNKPWSHEKFLAKVSEANPHIKILGKYKNVRSKIKSKCLLCSGISNVYANILMYPRKSCVLCSPEVISKSLKIHYLHNISKNLKIPNLTYDKLIDSKIKKKLGKNYSYISRTSYNRRNRYLHSVKCPRGHVYTYVDKICSCKICFDRTKRKSNKLFLKQLKLLRGNKIKPLELYNGARTKIKFKCDYGHILYVTPDTMLNKRNSACAQCGKGNRYSQPCMDWLNDLSKRFKIKIQHIGNGSEFRPASNLFADGYNKRKNIVFEFYGDFYHGNPIKYGTKDECDKAKVSFKEMRKRCLKTVLREYRLKKLGYKLITIWEYDYKNNYQEWLFKNKPAILER